jgi:toxin ParE1/3/4
MVQIVLSRIAKQDLKDIVDYIKRNSVHYAYLENKKIQEAIDQLSYQPLIGKVLPEQEDINLREMIFRNYRIIYQIEDNTKIQILTIHHHSRLLANNPAIKDEE